MSSIELEALLKELGWSADPSLKDIWTDGARGKFACYWTHPRFPKKFVLVVSDKAADCKRRTAEAVQDLALIYDAPDVTILQAKWLLGQRSG